MRATPPPLRDDRQGGGCRAGSGRQVTRRRRAGRRTRGRHQRRIRSPWQPAATEDAGRRHGQDPAHGPRRGGGVVPTPVFPSPPRSVVPSPAHTPTLPLALARLHSPRSALSPRPSAPAPAVVSLAASLHLYLPPPSSARSLSRFLPSIGQQVTCWRSSSRLESYSDNRTCRMENTDFAAKGGMVWHQDCWSTSSSEVPTQFGGDPGRCKQHCSSKERTEICPRSMPQLLPFKVPVEIIKLFLHVTVKVLIGWRLIAEDDPGQLVTCYQWHGGNESVTCYQWHGGNESVHREGGSRERKRVAEHGDQMRHMRIT